LNQEILMADYGHDVQFGFFLDPTIGNPDRTLEVARILDDLKFDLIGIQDHPYNGRHFDALALSAVILGQTKQIRVFPDVANLPLRPPAMLAKQAATLDQLSGGRFELGLGAGAFWDAIRAMGGPVRTPGEAIGALREAIAVIRAYWSGETVREVGGYYQVPGARPGPVPAPARAVRRTSPRATPYPRAPRSGTAGAAGTACGSRPSASSSSTAQAPTGARPSTSTA